MDSYPFPHIDAERLLRLITDKYLEPINQAAKDRAYFFIEGQFPYLFRQSSAMHLYLGGNLDFSMVHPHYKNRSIQALNVVNIWSSMMSEAQICETKSILTCYDNHYKTVENIKYYLSRLNNTHVDVQDVLYALPQNICELAHLNEPNNYVVSDLKEEVSYKLLQELPIRLLLLT